MKKVLSIIITVATLILAPCPVFAQSSSWAAGNIERALSLNIISKDLASKSKENATRLDFCKIAVYFYEAFSGKSGVTLVGSPFFDIDNPAVNKCHELGIVSGIDNNIFGPNGYITREEMADLIVQTLIACGTEIDYTMNTNSLKTNFRDLNDIYTDYVKDVKILAFENVLSGYGGYFYPKAYVTIEQMATAFVKAYDVFKSYGLSIDGNYILIGDSKESVTKKFGEPDRINKNIYDTDRYTYNKDYKSFFMVSFKDGKVADIFSNSPALSYRGITPGDTIDNFSQFTSKGLSHYDEIKIENYNLETTLCFDYSGGYKLDAVYIRDTRLSVPGNSYNIMIPLNTEKELADIINVYRFKNGLEPLDYSSSAYRSAKNYSTYMRENQSFGYIDLEGRSPFDRMVTAGIKYSVAAENIAYMSGDSISIYRHFTGQTATKSNILMPGLTDMGIGCTLVGNQMYTVVDMFGM